MTQRAMEQRAENLERRVEKVEQILPTVATKDDLAELKTATKADLVELKTELKADLVELKTELKADLVELKTELKADWTADLAAAIAPLATKAELHAAIAPLATKAEVKAQIKAEGEQTRRHFDVVADGMRAEIRLFAEKIDAVEVRVDARHADAMRILTQHDRRITRLKASSPLQP